MSVRVIEGDCVALMSGWRSNTISAIVCDPPYGIAFMGRAFDRLGDGANQQRWHADWLREALRVLRPGGHLCAFGGTRTFHRLVSAAEDVGFEIRDMLVWLYGSGFPKSHNVAKAFDRAAGELRAESRAFTVAGVPPGSNVSPVVPIRGYVPPAPITDDAKRWQGWGTALKPAHEPILLARKPLGGTVAESVRRHGTGALNVAACRVPTADGEPGSRWPANLLLSHAAACAVDCAPRCPVAALDAQSGESGSPGGVRVRSGASDLGRRAGWNPHAQTQTVAVRPADRGGASRFFTRAPLVPLDDPSIWPTFRYTSKASKSERQAGCEQLAQTRGRKRGNNHPTVKPIAIMRWLLQLVTPPGGLVVDPFAGSGTTGVAAAQLGINAWLIEADPAYVEIARARVEHAQSGAADVR